MRLRTLAHDLSNSIETVMQASYLLAQAKLDDGNKKWVELIDNAARDAARINREIREILRRAVTLQRAHIHVVLPHMSGAYHIARRDVCVQQIAQKQVFAMARLP